MSRRIYVDVVTEEYIHVKVKRTVCVDEGIDYGQAVKRLITKYPAATTVEAILGIGKGDFYTPIGENNLDTAINDYLTTDKDHPITVLEMNVIE